MSKTIRTNKELLSGNESLARGAYEAGLKVACAYPGTPSSEILETLAEYPAVDVQWSVNEKVAFEVALGAAIGGARSLYASKNVGLNVAMDPLMTASYTGILAGFVVVVCDDPGTHSSQNEQDTRWVSIYAKLPLLEPASPSEAKEYVAEAFKISERFDTPVLVRMTTRVSHSKEDVRLGNRTAPKRLRFVRDIQKYTMTPAHARVRHVKVEQRLTRMKNFAEKTRLNKIESADGKIGFITSGPSYNYLKEKYPSASYLKLGMTYPFCDDKIRNFAHKIKKLYVIEELDPFLEEHIKSLGISFKAKDTSFRVGELGPDVISDVVGRRKKKAIQKPKNSPRMCPTCPHRHTFTVLKKLGIFVSGDIGCYGLACNEPFKAIHTIVCMGAGVTFNEGLRRANTGETIVGVVGDSTFIHSGITGLINAAYNKSSGVILILDNSITAMTGGQQHPGTGLTIRNEPTKKLVLEDLCKSCGVDYVDVVDPKQRANLERLLKKRLRQDVLSVIIVRSPCKLIKAR